MQDPAIKPYQFYTPCIAVIAIIDAKPYHPAIVHSNLANHINHSVHWIDTIQYLMSKEDMQFLEVGPGNVLTGLVNRIKGGKLSIIP